MLTYSYTESNRPQIIKIRATPGKMYTASDLRSISHVHAVFALPSVPRVYTLQVNECLNAGFNNHRMWNWLYFL